MGVFSDALKEEVRLEYMRPGQIEAARDKRPAVYIPFGVLEWHGYQNASGLDSLKAHEHLVGLASRVGGVVHPPIYFGSGGGHCDWPFSYFYKKETIQPLIVELLQGLERNGYKAVIMLTGHYPNAWELLQPAKAAYIEAGGKMHVLDCKESIATDGDHAAKYETSSMLYLHPKTVDMDIICNAEPKDFGGADEKINWMEDEYKDHPNYGIVGIDPRAHASAQVGKENTELLLNALSDWLDGKIDQPDEEWKGFQDNPNPVARA